MSSELERLLRDAQRALPEPCEPATTRARERALQAVRRQPRRSVRIAALSITSFAIVLAVGIGIGALVTPSGRAAKDAVGLGFLPAPGWTAFQTGGEVNPIFQTVAIASNVPLDPEDQVAGAADPSGLPLATLEELPASGVVITASFTRLTFGGNFKSDLPPRQLPLRLSDATRYVQYGTQVRPEDPLGEWQIRAFVNSHEVNVMVYFGTASPSAALRADANRQLERLVVESAGSARRQTERSAAAPSAATAPASTSATNVIERTLSCVTGVKAGTHVVYVGAQSGTKKGKAFKNPAQAYVTTAGSTLATDPTGVQPQIVAMNSGYPTALPLHDNGVGYDPQRCKPVKADVPFTRRGMAGGVAGQFGQQSECFPPATVLVHFRAVFAAPPAVRIDKKTHFYIATGRIKAGQIALETPNGKPLAYVDVLRTGRSRGFTAGSCY